MKDQFLADDMSFNELVEQPELDTRHYISGIVFYVDDGPLYPDDATKAERSPAIMAIGLAGEQFMMELATMVRQGKTAFSKNRINPRIAPFYQRDLIMFPPEVHDWIDDVDLTEMNSDDGQGAAND